MPEAEFDRCAAAYEAQHRHSIRFTGESTDYFAAYKVAIAAGEAPAADADHAILDFGGGTGNSLSHFRRHFLASRICLADPSAKSLEIAHQRFPDAGSFHLITGSELPFDRGSFDLAFAACVFHHIQEAQHVVWLSELKRVLKPGGRLLIFEHNPANPLTRKAVRDCPFDEGAVLIRPAQMRERLQQADFTAMRMRYTVFFPGFLRGLRPLESWLGHVPLGGQYYISASA
jgi:ubiquinone/menaquinone biosynthesis C-methylase UbiE